MTPGGTRRDEEGRITRSSARKRKATAAQPEEAQDTINVEEQQGEDEEVQILYAKVERVDSNAVLDQKLAEAMNSVDMLTKHLETANEREARMKEELAAVKKSVVELEKLREENEQLKMEIEENVEQMRKSAEEKEKSEKMFNKACLEARTFQRRAEYAEKSLAQVDQKPVGLALLRAENEDNSELKQKVDDLTKEIEEAKKETEEWKNKLESEKSEKERFKRLFEKACLEARSSELRAEYAEKTLDQKPVGIVPLSKENSELKQQVDNLSRESTIAKKEATEWKQQCEMEKSKNEKKLEEVKKDVNRLRKDRNEWIDKANSEKQRRERDVGHFTEDAKRLRKERDEWRDKYGNAKSELRKKLDELAKRGDQLPSLSRSSSVHRTDHSPLATVPVYTVPHESDSHAPPLSSPTYEPLQPSVSLHGVLKHPRLF
ncbi:hypothetical protein PFISCL1PPCAC_6702 [Pristionchus fissidentatus]|uniref:Uncharacterized protein n=1 Tax=Pristionchus fissidentatus TaxID=1538716 RepID=A0AAV5VBW4_9BILA|nr:hypothetical protein PFISCL1PPCAC_6702 [Pristionchus fissidentatus]